MRRDVVQGETGIFPAPFHRVGSLLRGGLRRLGVGRDDRRGRAALTMPLADFRWFVDHALDEMLRIVADLGDDLASTRPDLPAANSPYAILTHCLGVMEYWGGETIAGRAITRDREAELSATGAVSDLSPRVAEARRRLDADLAHFDPLAPPLGTLHPATAGRPYARTQAAVLVHLYEELSQHLGQMEITRDLLRR